MKALLFSGLLACAPIVMSPRVHAEGLEQVEASPEEVAATRMYRTGIQKLREGQFAMAVSFFERSLPVMRAAPELFYNLVQATRQTEQWDRLVLYAQGFLQREQGTKDATAIARLMKQTFDLLEGWGQRSGSYHFQVSPAGAEVFINGVPVPNDGSEVRLMPGSYVVSAEQADHVTWRDELVVTAGTDSGTITRTLAPRVYRSKVRISTAPGTEVFIDDKPIGTTPLADIELDTHTRYLFRFEKPGHDSWVRYVELRKDEVYELSPKLESVAGDRTVRNKAPSRGLDFP